MILSNARMQINSEKDFEEHIKRHAQKQKAFSSELGRMVVIVLQYCFEATLNIWEAR